MKLMSKLIGILLLITHECLFANPTLSPKVLQVITTVNPNNALIMDFQVKTDSPSKIKIYYQGAESDTGKFVYIPPMQSYTKLQRFSVVRLRSQTRYNFKIIASDELNHLSLPYEGTFITRQLPANLAEARIALMKGTKTSYPLTLFDQNHTLSSPPPEQYSPAFNGMVIVDSTGHIVWYYESKLQIPGRTEPAIGDIKQAENIFYVQGGLASGGYDNRIFALSPSGDILFQSPSVCTSIAPVDTNSPSLTGGAHHEIQRLADGKVLYLGHEVRYIKDLSFPLQNGTSIREWDPKTNNDRQVWSVFDFFNPITDRTPDSNGLTSLGCNNSIDANEWTHGNSFSPGVSGNYIWNSRHIDTLVSLGSEPDPRIPNIALCNAKNVKRKDLVCRQWRLGAHEQFSDFTFPNPADKFFHAHSAFQLPNADPMKTNILIYDNGATRPQELGGEYSRALELELDFRNMTAKKVWEFRYKPDLFTIVVGRVIRLSNGHTMINFGSNPTIPNPYGTHRVVEVDEKGNIVAEIDVYSAGKIVQYRANPLNSIAGEIEI